MHLNPNRPFRPDKWPFFYGWVVVPLACFGIMTSIPGQTIGVSPFTDSLIDVLKISRFELALAYCIGTMCSGLLLPRAGRFLDKHGSRVIMVFSCLLLSITLISLSYLDKISAFLPKILFNGTSIQNIVLMGFGFFWLRFSGQGLVTMTSQNMLGKWFKRKRGTVAGIAGVIKSCGFAFAPYILKVLIIDFGWSMTWHIFSIVAMVMALVAWVFFRDNPEECGLLMDGEEACADDEVDTDESSDVEAKLALRTPEFWAIALSLGVLGTTVTGIFFHLEDLAAKVNIDGETIFKIFIPIGILSPMVGITLGRLVDHVKVKYLILVLQFFMVISFMSYGHLGTRYGWVLIIIPQSICGAYYGILSTVAIPHYFGRKHLGEISGNVMRLTVCGSAIGPLILAVSNMLTDSYMPALYCFCTLPILTFFIALRIKEDDKVRKKD
ncbi:MAG: MFS transporter [Lentisphaeria bacterium]|nr:MFS transporter [Lentisphaeria bacterium]